MQIEKSSTPELEYARVGSWIGLLKTRTIREFLTLNVVFLLAGCSAAPPIAFQNTSHRETYSLTLEDLQKL